MIKGVLTAMITPFDKKGELDADGLRRNIRDQIENGVDGIVVLGTTGEAPTLLQEEKMRIVETTLEEVAGRLPVIVGTGSYATQATIENTHQAKGMGASAALIITPYYNKPTQEGIFRHFMSVADKAGLPIIIYNHQGRTGQGIALSTMRRLASHPNIVGVKECSGSLSQMADIYSSICTGRPDFSLLSGDDPLILPSISIGAHGVVSVLSNLLPGAITQLVRHAETGDLASARSIHYHLLPLFHALFIETNPIPLKAAMEHMGLPAGGCRLPLCEMEPANKTRLIETLEAIFKHFHQNKHLTSRPFR